MTIIICLLALIAMILLFGAGLVRHWLLMTLFAIVGGGMAIFLLLSFANLLGENGLYIILGVGAAGLIALWFYADIMNEDLARELRKQRDASRD